MPDLKAAAERLRERLNPSGANYVMVRDERRSAAMCVEAQDGLLAAQALEALAWQAETGAGVRRKFTGNCWKWACYAPGGRSWFEYVADTPLGSILAAMEGEMDSEAN